MIRLGGSVIEKLLMFFFRNFPFTTTYDEESAVLLELLLKIEQRLQVPNNTPFSVLEGQALSALRSSFGVEGARPPTRPWRSMSLQQNYALQRR